MILRDRNGKIMRYKGNVLRYEGPLSPFISGTGFNNDVNIVAVDKNNKLYVGGRFSMYNGNYVNKIIRLNEDGSIDTRFNYGSGFDQAYVSALIVDENNKIYVGGNFTSYNGVTAYRIIRLNNDGSIDTGFNSGSGFDDTGVYSSIIDKNNKIYVGGAFTSYNGTTANGIIRLNEDGSIDTGFNSGDGFSEYSIVRGIAIDKNDKIYVTGSFHHYDHDATYRIVRLNEDGSRDYGFRNKWGFDRATSGIAIDKNNKVYVGGNFTSYAQMGDQTINVNRIARLNEDGSVDTEFNIGSGFNGVVGPIAIDKNDKIYVGGSFSTYNGTSIFNIIRLNPDGTVS